MVVFLETEVKRMENNSVWLPEHFWEHLGVEKGGSFKAGLDRGKYGVYVALYKAKGEDEKQKKGD